MYDDGSLPGLRGTHKYDDEGMPSRRNDLIKDGILVGRLHSRETAARMKEQPTGNARALNYRHAPIVRMTNTAIEPGHTSFQDMIKDIRLGVYACDAFGGNTALENFSFSSGYAYMIRDGQVAEMVKDVILAGNLFETLMNIDAIGDDFSWIQSCRRMRQGRAERTARRHRRAAHPHPERRHWREVKHREFIHGHRHPGAIDGPGRTGRGRAPAERIHDC